MHKMTASEAKQKILAILDANPDAANPMEDKWCLYTSKDGDSHCVVGQLAANEGWRVPDSSERSGVQDVWMAFEWPLTLEAADVLYVAQRGADTATTRGMGWGDAAMVLRKDWGMV